MRYSSRKRFVMSLEVLFKGTDAHLKWPCGRQLLAPRITSAVFESSVTSATVAHHD